MNKAETYNSTIIDELLQEISPEELEKTKQRMILAAYLDDIIKAKGWKRKDFAQALGKTPSEITKWLSGTHNFTSDTLFAIERALRIKLIKLDNRPQEIINTYIFRGATQSVQEPQGHWDYLYDLDPFYKTKFNTGHSN